MVTAKAIVEQAFKGNYIGIPYSELDCQALVERILSDCGEKHDWRGSNHMWREALTEKHKITNESEIPAGVFLFTLKQDGGEKERGYNDNEGNASHVGLYLGLSRVIHSTTGGVQWDDISRSRWTHYGLCKYIDYTDEIWEEKKKAEYYKERNKLIEAYSSQEQSTSTPRKNYDARLVKYIDVSSLSDEEIFDLLNGVNNPWMK